MADLDRDGVTIHYQVHGSGPTVLLSHGYSATSAMWRPQLEALADRYQVVTWDIRGHGMSDAPADDALYSEALCLSDMAALLDAVGAERAHVGGLSLGGYLSLAFHVEHPQRCQSLLLFDTGPGYRNDAARAQWNETAEGRARFFERYGLTKIDTRSDAHGGTHHSAEGLARAARGILRQFDSRVMDSLPHIAVPVLVLVGADDTPFVGPAEYMARKIPGAELVVLEGAGHEANLDQPAAFNAAVLDFLARNPG